MSRDHTLRTERLAFYEKDMERLNSELDAFLELSGARCALLIAREGHLVTRRGEPLGSSLDAVAALIAGSFAATREMARLLGEEEFSVMFHQGVRDSIQLQLVGERTLLAVLFDERTNLGLVRFYAQEIAPRIADILHTVATQPVKARLADNFHVEAAQVLDKLF